MTIHLTVVDETTSGGSEGEFRLELPDSELTVRELIRSRVYQEVKDFNVRRPAAYQGLVQPDEVEVALNGLDHQSGRKVDWHRQFDTAVKAFEHQRLLVLVDGKQVDELDQVITLRPDSKIRFLKLIPLIGG